MSASGRSSAILRSQARWGYRRLLKTAQEVFAADDFAKNQAKVALRSHYDQYASVDDVEEQQKLVDEIDPVIDLLRNNIVQGKSNEKSGVYEVKLTDPQKNSMRTNEQLSPIDAEKIPEKVVSAVEVNSSKCGCNSSDHL